MYKNVKGAWSVIGVGHGGGTFGYGKFE